VGLCLRDATGERVPLNTVRQALEELGWDVTATADRADLVVTVTGDLGEVRDELQRHSDRGARVQVFHRTTGTLPALQGGTNVDPVRDSLFYCVLPGGPADKDEIRTRLRMQSDRRVVDTADVRQRHAQVPPRGATKALEEAANEPGVVVVTGAIGTGKTCALVGLLREMASNVGAVPQAFVTYAGPHADLGRAQASLHAQLDAIAGRPSRDAQDALFNAAEKRQEEGRRLVVVAGGLYPNFAQLPPNVTVVASSEDTAPPEEARVVELDGEYREETERAVSDYLEDYLERGLGVSFRWAHEASIGELANAAGPSFLAAERLAAWLGADESPDAILAALQNATGPAGVVRLENAVRWRLDAEGLHHLVSALNALTVERMMPGAELATVVGSMDGWPPRGTDDAWTRLVAALLDEPSTGRFRRAWPATEATGHALRVTLELATETGPPPWALGTDAFVIPSGTGIVGVGSEVLGGQLAARLREELGSERWSLLMEAIRAAQGDTPLTAEAPLLVEIAPDLQATVACRFMILATAMSGARGRAELAGQAASAVAQVAESTGCSSLAMPLLGSGGGGEDSGDMANAMVKELRERRSFGSLRRVRLTTHVAAARTVVALLGPDLADDDLAKLRQAVAKLEESIDDIVEHLDARRDEFYGGLSRADYRALYRLLLVANDDRWASLLPPRSEDQRREVWCAVAAAELAGAVDEVVAMDWNPYPRGAVSLLERLRTSVQRSVGRMDISVLIGAGSTRSLSVTKWRDRLEEIAKSVLWISFEAPWPSVPALRVSEHEVLASLEALGGQVGAALRVQVTADGLEQTHEGAQVRSWSANPKLAVLELPSIPRGVSIVHVDEGVMAPPDEERLVVVGRHAPHGVVGAAIVKQEALEEPFAFDRSLRFVGVAADGGKLLPVRVAADSARQQDGSRQHRVFIAYARSDLGRAEELAVALEEAGLSVFRDADVVAGESWRDRIENEIEQSDSVVVLWSHAAANSDFLEQEIGVAEKSFTDRGRPYLLPVLLDETPVDHPALRNRLGVPWRSRDDLQGVVAAVLAQERRLGTIDIDSQFYVERRADLGCRKLLDEPRAIVVVHGPMQTGKSLLLRRLARDAAESGYRTAYLSIRELPEEALASAATGVPELFRRIHNAFDDDRVWEDLWEDGDEPVAAAWAFVERMIQGGKDPMAVFLDDIDILVTSALGAEVMAPLAALRERGVYAKGGDALRVFVSSSWDFTELFPDFTETAGWSIPLQSFSAEETRDLAQRRGVDAPDLLREIDALVCGHPHLTQVALASFAEHGRADFLSQATSMRGPFGEHIARLRAALDDDEEGRELVAASLAGAPPSAAEDVIRRVLSLGILLEDATGELTFATPWHERVMRDLPLDRAAEG